LFGPDDDAEGEDDFEENGDEGGDPEDQQIYCFCQKLSYGEVSGSVFAVLGQG
jgi:chromatin modification-related protein YNG2